MKRIVLVGMALVMVLSVITLIFVLAPKDYILVYNESTNRMEKIYMNYPPVPDVAYIRLDKNELEKTTPTTHETIPGEVIYIGNDQNIPYSVGISKGDMQFVYSSGKIIRDIKPQLYKQTIPGWLINNSIEIGSEPTDYYLENGSNKITITNYSEIALDVYFEYVLVSDNIFNDGEGIDNVVGGFYATSDEAQVGALVLENPKDSSDFNTLPGGKLTLPSTVGRDAGDPDLTGEVYFAMSGTPDVGRSDTLTDFTQTGYFIFTITQHVDETPTASEVDPTT